MSGKTAVGWLREARESGFMLKAYFLWVRDPEIVLRRVRRRVIEGGHNVPEETSHRRFFKTLQNFFVIYRPIMTSWKLLENEDSGARLLAVEKAGRLMVRDRSRLDEILRRAEIEL